LIWRGRKTFQFCYHFRTPKDGEYFEGNARYEGYSLDLIDGISKILGFKYIFELVPDKAYGSYNKETKQWNGLIRQLLDRVSAENAIKIFK
jgi:glutamate receptor, ionotropic, invertebrate